MTIVGARGAPDTAAITAMDDATFKVADCTLVGGRADVGGSSICVDVNPMGVSSNGAPHVAASELVLGQSGAGADGVGIFARDTVLIVEDNTFRLAVDPGGDQKGIRLQNALPGTQLLRNTIDGAPSATGAETGILLSGGSALVAGNQVFPGACDSGGCRGIQILNDPGVMRIENNIVFGGGGAVTSCALEYFTTSVSAPDIVVHSNLFDGGTGGISSVAIRWGNTGAPTAQVGRFFNNIIRAGTGATRRGFREGDAAFDPLQVDNSAFFMAPGGTDVSVYFDEDSVALDDAAAIDSQVAEATASVVADCNSEGRAFAPRLMSGSACVDAGTDQDAPTTDFFGNDRPLGSGFDIGPHELAP